MIMLFSFSIFYMNLVAAQSDEFISGVTEIVQSIIDLGTEAGKPLFEALLGPVDKGGDLFTKVLIFLLVALITIAVLEQVDFFEERLWMQFGVGVITSIIGIRFLPDDMINAIAFPSSVFVASISIGFPFLLYGIVLHKGVKSKYLRRVGWIIFAVILFVLWIYNARKSFFYLYPLFLLASFIAFWFDGTLQKFRLRYRSERTVARATKVAIHSIEGEIRLLQSSLAASTDLGEIRELKKEIKEKIKALKELTKTLE